MELALRQEAGVATQDDAAFEAAASSDAYLPRFQLMTSSSEKCKRGEFPINHYAIVEGQTFTDLDKEVDVLVLSWHPKALDMSGDAIVASYDTTSDLYKDIQTKSGVKDSKCMFGPEYLLYIPSVGKYATFFLGSKSARKEARSIQALLENAATIKSKLIEWKTYSWQAPVIIGCSTEFEIPPREDLVAKVKQFHDSENVPEPELAPEDEGRVR
jgi:hypothetical protein